MYNAFTSACIIQKKILPSHSLQPHIADKEPDFSVFLPSNDEWDLINNSYIQQVCSVITQMMPALQVFSEWPTRTTKINLDNDEFIPMPVCFKNEQKYAEVVDIMDEYESMLAESYKKAGKNLDGVKIHVGGDQMTRERFSGAKRLRATGTNSRERFNHLSPITFEFFHLAMNYQELIMKQLYKEKSAGDLGTMRCEKSRTSRTQVNEDVKKAYDANKDFINSFVRSYIAVAVMDYFGMDSTNATPTVNHPPQHWNNSQEKISWIQLHGSKIIDTYVLPKVKGIVNTDLRNDSNIKVDGLVVKIKLKNGQQKNLLLPQAGNGKTSPDAIKNYSHRVLELGMLYASFLELVKEPDRDLGIAVLKIMMLYLKAANRRSKYASEIQRFLVHQLCTLSTKEAIDEFYGLFVKTNGGFIPADLRMEHYIKDIKRNVKHMFSNQTETNIERRTGSLYSLKLIAENFDSVSSVITRCEQHSSVSSDGDERSMAEDIKSIQAFKSIANRKHHGFPNVKDSLLLKLNPGYCAGWLREQTAKWRSEIGN